MNVCLGAGYSGSRIHLRDGRVCLTLPGTPTSDDAQIDFWRNNFEFKRSRSLELNNAYTWTTECDQVNSVLVTDYNVHITIEGLAQEQLTITCCGKNNTVVLDGNDLGKLTIYDRGHNTTIDLSQQEQSTCTYETTPTTKLIQALCSAPSCCTCTAASATKAFYPCGHWGICQQCANTNPSMCCPICRGVGRMISLFVV